MKKIQLKNLIREEIRRVLKEAATIDSTLLNKLKVAMTARMRDPENENAHDEVEDILTQIYKKMGAEDAEGLAASNMEDEVTMTGPVSAVVTLIKDTLSEPMSKGSSKSVYINDTFNDYTSATITKTSTGSEIIDRMRNWKYAYPGSPQEMIEDLIQSKGVRKAGSGYIESNTEKESILKAIKTNSKFKKIKVS